MDQGRRLAFQTRSLSAVLFLLPQAAQNVREILRCAGSIALYDALQEEKALFDQREALLGKFYKAVELMSRDGWDFADERLAELIAECGALRRGLDREMNRRYALDYRKKIEGALLGAAENPRRDDTHGDQE